MTRATMFPMGLVGALVGAAAALIASTAPVAAENGFEKRRDDALADCGQEPGLIGGPVSSFTYKWSAVNQARRKVEEMPSFMLEATDTMLCVKTIEYVRTVPAANGRNLAEVIMRGYGRLRITPMAVNASVPY